MGDAGRMYLRGKLTLSESPPFDRAKLVMSCSKLPACSTFPLIVVGLPIFDCTSNHILSAQFIFLSALGMPGFKSLKKWHRLYLRFRNEGMLWGRLCGGHGSERAWGLLQFEILNKPSRSRNVGTRRHGGAGPATYENGYESRALRETMC